MHSADNILVIGGGGFIGRALVRQLLGDGCSVRVMSRRAALDQAGVSFVRGSVADRDTVMRAVQGVSVVYDLSMGGGPRWEDYERDFIGGARTVAECCLATRVRRLIYTSSSAALYLGSRGILTEAAGTDSRPHIRGMYSRGKILAERVLLDLWRTQNLPVVIMRPAIVVGPGGKLAHPGIGNWTSPTCVVGPGSGGYPLPFVHVDDVARALFLAKDAPGIDGMTFNLAGDVRPTAREYVAWVAERSLRNFRFYPRSILRMQAFRIMTWLVKAAVRKPDNAWPTYHEMKTATKRAQLDCSAAKEYLGWRPISGRDEFIRRAIDCHLPPIRKGDLRLA